MNRARSLLILVALGAACSGGSQKPGAMLRGPGALAIFDGIVAHESGSYREYLAVANSRGDELRLVDLTDNEVVESPGLVFPLSVPTEGRPMWLASADLNDGELPDVLVVVAAGSNLVEVIDTWSGHPTAVDALATTLPSDAEVISIAGVKVPVSAIDGTAAPDVGRILLGLTGNRLAVLDFRRDPADLAGLAVGSPTVTVLSGLGFDPFSLSQGADARLVYAASREALPGGKLGVAELRLSNAPSGPTDWSLRELDALGPTEAVAAVRFAGVNRVIAAQSGGLCGVGKECLVAVDPDGAWATGRGDLLANLTVGIDPLDGVPYRLPIPVPGTVGGLLAVGRPSAPLRIGSGSGPLDTTALAVVSSTDGGVYLVDAANWAMVSNTNPLTGGGKTRVSAASVVVGTRSTIGLWTLDGTSLSVDSDDFAARVRTTPGFTPDDDWTLSWQGTLPGLDTRGAILGRDTGGLWLSVQVGAAAPVPLRPLGVSAGDLVALADLPDLCPNGVELAVTLVELPDGLHVRLADPVAVVSDPAPVVACRNALLALATTETATATFRAGQLLLVGATSGQAGRPALTLTPPYGAPTEHRVDSAGFPGRFGRLFYVMDDCADAATCDPAWTAPPSKLTFPLPTGPALGLRAGLADALGAPTGELPSRETAIRFTTKSGLVASGRRPIKDGKALASELPVGLAVFDPTPDVASTGVQVQASYTAGIVMIFSSAASTTSMALVR